MKTKRGIAWILGLLMFFSLVMGTSEMQVYAAGPYAVNFGNCSWEVGGATVSASVDATLNEGKLNLAEDGSINITLNGFNKETMEVILSGTDKCITLPVVDKTTISLSVENCSEFSEETLTFSVVAKPSEEQETPQNSPEPEKKEEKKEEKKVETVVQKEVPTKEKAPANIVQLPGGEKAVSSIGGVYNVESVEGVAVVTQKKDVYSAVGLSNEEVKAGTNVVLYMSDCLNKKASQPLNDVAVAANKKVAAYLTADMYTITKKGVINKVRETGAPVELLIGVPQSARSANRQFSVVCIDPSKNVVTYNDMDTNPDTITVCANVFGNYAVVY